MMFQVGLVLSIEIPESKVCALTRVIGWEKDLFLVAKFPMLDEKLANIKTKETYVVRFVKDGAAYGFQAEVLSIQFYPSPLIFLKYPLNIESMPFRKSKRYKTNMIAKLINAGDVAAVDATIVDISESGCKLRLPTIGAIEYEADKTYRIKFMIMDKTFELSCEVKNISASAEHRVLGTQFVDISPESRRVIESFIGLLKDSSD